MPAKALLYAAEVLHRARHVEPWGIRAENVGFDFAKVMAHKDTLIRGFAEERREQLANGAFKFIRATAKFLDPHSIAVSNGGSITAAHFVVTTGSTIAPAPLLQLHDVGYLTSDDALKLTQLPKSLIVLGGGPVAVEFAPFFARFGAQVTLLQRSAHLLGEFDVDAAKEIERVFRRGGIKVFTNTKLTDARRDDHGKTISFHHDRQPLFVSADDILVALGRAANTASLDLDKAGVATKSGRMLIAISFPFCLVRAPAINPRTGAGR
jgi:pyruvate/2-oxoglutarate dehydrogenase complex dihydrolipoamide dehydrogenase (E3) component